MLSEMDIEGQRVMIRAHLKLSSNPGTLEKKQ